MEFLVLMIMAKRRIVQSILMLSLAFIVLTSCKKTSESATSVPQIIIDTDMGSDCDDVGALAILNEYANRGKANILGVIYSSEVVPYGVGVIDAINVFYNNEHIPIGASHDTLVGDKVDKMQAQKLALDSVAFKNRYKQSSEVKEQTLLNRSLLAEAEAASVIYLTIGHTKGLYDLLVSKPDSISELSGLELVNQKVKKWVALGALGALNEDKVHVKDWNFFFNNTATYTEYLIKNFPASIYLVDGGADVMTGKSLLRTPNGNIVRTAYRDWLWKVEKKTLADQRPSWDLAAVYYAVNGIGDFFNLEIKGILEFDAERGCRGHRVQPNADSKFFFVTQKDSIGNEFADYLNDLLVSYLKN